MRRTPLALLSAALLVLPFTAASQPQSQPQTKAPPQRVRAATAPSPLSGLYLAGRVAEQNHDYDKGSDQFDLALAQSPNDPTLIYDAFRLRVYAGRFEAAVQIAPAVLAIKPGDGFANLVMMISQIKKGDYRAAEQQLGKMGQDNQLGPLRDYVVIWLKAGQKDFTAARAGLARLKPAAGDRAESPALVISAQIDELAGDTAAAETKYRRSVELDPGGLRIALSVAEGLKRLGKTNDARALLTTYGNKFGDSVVMDGQIAAPPPKSVSPAAGIADILFDIGGILGGDPRGQRADLALIFQQLATELKPDHDFAWLTISSLFEQFQIVPKAVAALGKIGPASPFSWQARLRTAALDAQEDRFDQAVSRLRGLVAEKPERTDAALTLGDLLRGKERYADAVTVYDTAVSRVRTVEERHWVLFFSRGIVLERTKQWPKAETDMKKALELSPEQPFVLNYLGYSWIDQGLNLDEGMKMLKRATALRPDDGAISDSVGWAYYRLGQFETAVQWLERATEQKGDDATIVEHLGDAYWHVGRRREARFEWERALNQKPEKDRVPILKDKLANGLNPGNDKPTVYEKPGDKKQGG